MPKTQAIAVESFPPGTEVFVADVVAVKVRKGRIKRRTVFETEDAMDLSYDIEPTDGLGYIRVANISPVIVFETHGEAEAEIRSRMATFQEGRAR
jgi:hypothetical protein